MKSGANNAPDFISIEELKKMVGGILNKVPSHIQEDCFNAALLGIINASTAANNADNKKGYFRQCIKSEIYKEIGSLYPVYSLQPTVLSMLYKYKKGESVTMSMETLSKLASLKFEYYSENEDGE